MASGGDDPTCPHCGEPVGARAVYCMHCGRDVAPAVDPGRTASDGDGAGIDGGQAPDDRSDGPAADSGRVDGTATGGFALAGLLGRAVPDGPPWKSRDPEPGPGATEPEAGASAGPEAGRGRLHPESLLDDSLTVAVGVVAGALVGAPALVALAFPFGTVGFLAAVVVWLGATAHLARRPTVFEAVRRGAYAFAAALVAVPAGVVLAADGGLATRAVALVLFEAGVGVVALAAVAVGYAAGRVAPERSDSGRDRR